jgi:bacterioferritin (cytochrome b1)
LAHFQYFLYAQIIEGIDAETLKKELERQSLDEMNHAKILANRIIQLGGTPTTKLIETLSFKLEEDFSSLNLIASSNSIMEVIRNVPLCTGVLVVRGLSSEVSSQYSFPRFQVFEEYDQSHCS